MIVTFSIRDATARLAADVEDIATEEENDIFPHIAGHRIGTLQMTNGFWSTR